MSSINLQESQFSGCETYIAIVVDESGSINADEADQIREGLAEFINSQAQSNITLSLIGMSNSDSDSRTDHVIQKRISGNQEEFLDWIDSYLGSAHPQSDYWASGLSVANNLTVIPDIVVIVTDGLQVNNPNLLKDLYGDLNEKSHVFVYGVTSSESNTAELLTPLNLYLGQTPVLKSNGLSMLNADYIRVPDFKTLGTELIQLHNDLSKEQIGCVANVSIIENKLVYPVLRKGRAVHQQAGSLVLKNRSRIDLTLAAGTRIHTSSNLNGLVFKLNETITISALSQAEVAIRIDGTPKLLGNHSELLFINKVKNPGGFTINFNVAKEIHVVDITSDSTALQSTSLQIAAAGSKGIDSTKGIHLRWFFADELGEKHLPKGNLFTGTNFHNFNKPDDFVKVYRAPYTKVSTTLNLTGNPQGVDNRNAFWIYKINAKRSIYVRFRKKSKYASVLLNINPLENAAAFIQAYGNNIIEIENKNELFFAAELNFTSVNTSSLVRLETLSVAENTILATKKVSNRKTYSSADAAAIRVVAENGRIIQLKANNCLLNEIKFEFYSDFITYANQNGNWELKGKFALNTDDSKVFEQLEPKLNSVHGKWLKYNNGEYVNINNYKDKWNKPTSDDDRNIKETVENYLSISQNEPLNPTATETVSFGDQVLASEPVEGQDPEYISNSTKVSNLDLLNIAANDYHVARMLGLGFIDIEEAVLSGEFIYLTEYTTLVDLKDVSKPKEVLHLSMSIPTSVATERLPLPVHLSKIVPGLSVNSEENEPLKITDENGYSFDGKKRFVSLFMKDILDYDTYNGFFSSSLEFDGSSFTVPVYAGVNHKIEGLNPDWVKPELASDPEYYNVNKDLEDSFYEPNPIVIPESGESLLNIRQEKVGTYTYIYQGYGINFFSRATSGGEISIQSEIKPANTLIPPTGINPLLITEEKPVMLTSQMEQARLHAIPGNDKSFIRLVFEYNAAHELIKYDIPEGMTVAEAEKTDTIYPDDKEVFADSFKLYFRDSLPLIEYAAIVGIQNKTVNDLTSVITVGKSYTIASTGEEINLNGDNLNRFVGGILSLGDVNYVIQNINPLYNTNDEFNGAEIHVLKKEVTDSILADGEATVDSEQIKEIQIPENRLCALVENMLTKTNWHPLESLDFQVDYPENLKDVNRETVKDTDSEGIEKLQIEKTRGIWENAVIERVTEKSYQMDAQGNFVLDTEENLIPLGDDDLKHLGLYKITFPNFNLPQHPQYKGQNIENSVEWFNGTIRLLTKSCMQPGSTIPVKPRKDFKVVRTENIGETGDLVVYVNDPDFKLGDYINQTMLEGYDEILGVQDYSGDYVSQKVNYYPGYKVYLFANPTYGITEANILPRAGESTHYSIFGMSTHSDMSAFAIEDGYDSKISTPSPMYAVKITAPKRPEKPNGGLFATRPDFFKRSTYTFTTEYKQKPYGLLHYRASDEALLSVLYKRQTINLIRERLSELGGTNDIYFGNRWQSLLNFDGLLDSNNALNPSDLLSLEDQPNPPAPRIPIYYEEYPEEGNPLLKYRFPVPDNEELINEINEFINWHNSSLRPNSPKVPNITSLAALNDVIIDVKYGVERNVLAIHFIEQAIHTAFVPLTEVPVVYDYINADPTYVPINKKQTIKDKNGYLLKATDTGFDIAPMMKITAATETRNAAQFTDFNLDGASQNFYFYGVREIDIKMNFGEFSPFLGPVKLVPSNPPQTPEIKRIMPILENPVLGIKPAIQIELNAYKPEYNIRKINIYRAKNMLDAQSIRTMTPVKEILINENTLSTDFNSVWTVYDEFEDLESVPFGDGLFYRITVSREIEYADPSSTDENKIINIDYTPSQPSKITATVIADTISPESPVLEASGNPTGTNGSILKPVIFSWEKTTHNGKYLLYKMNNQGNWEKIHEIASNESTVSLPLADVAYYTDELVIKNEDDERIYHHFKVIAVNSSGMFSSEEKILTL